MLFMFVGLAYKKFNLLLHTPIIYRNKKNQLKIEMLHYLNFVQKIHFPKIVAN